MPTLTISGASSIQDSQLRGSQPTWNYGAGVNLSLDNGTNRVVHRLSTASIPTGAILGATLRFCTITAGSTVKAYVVSDANYDWVEGTGASAPQEGSVSWGNKAWSATTPVPWAGSAGLSTAGTDYDNDASPPSITSVTDNYVDMTIPPAWLTAWKSGSHLNGGIVLIASVAASGYRSTAATKSPSWIIDYLVCGPQALTLSRGSMIATGVPRGPYRAKVSSSKTEAEIDG